MTKTVFQKEEPKKTENDISSYELTNDLYGTEKRGQPNLFN